MGLSPALAKKIAEAKASASGNRIKEGMYVLELLKVICEQKFKGTMFIAEMLVRESAAISDKVEPNKVGTTCSIAYNLDGGGKAGEAAKSNTKKFVCALFGLDLECDGDEFTEKLSHILDDKQPARGMLISCETVRQEIQTGKMAGTEGVFPRFEHVDQTDKEITERRKALDAEK